MYYLDLESGEMVADWKESVGLVLFNPIKEGVELSTSGEASGEREM